MTISENIILTARNQTRQALNDLERDARKAGGALDKGLAQGAQKAGKATAEASKGALSFQQSLMGVAKGALAAAGIASAGVAIKKAFDLGREGAQLERTQEKFDRLARSIGTTGQALSRDLQAATRGTMSRMEAMASATDFLSLGLAKTHDEAVRLTRVAAALGMNMNQLVLTLTNKTTMRFDALGVAVDGFEDKVKSLEEAGYSADEAFKLAFMQQAEEQIARVGDVADTNAGKIMKMDAAIANMSDTLKMKAAPAVATFAELVTDMLELKAENWFNEGADAAAKFINNLFGLKDETEEVTRATARFDEELAPGELTRRALALQELEMAEKRAAEQTERLKQEMSDLQLMIAGPLGKANEDFIEKLDALKGKAADLRGQIDELEGKRYLTRGQKEELEGLRSEFGEVQAAIGATADAHDEATKRILFNILTQRAEIGGLSQEEYNALVNIAQGWGLVDQSTATAMRTADLFFQGVATGADLSLEEIKELDRWMRGLPSYHQFTINTSYTYTGTAPYTLGPIAERRRRIKGQHGLDMTVPPGFPNDSFHMPLAVTSGERVTVTPAAQAGRGGGEIVNYITQHIYPSQGSDEESIARLVVNKLNFAVEMASRSGMAGYSGG